jgi:Zn-dependent peptidase ImmA (M78 family)
MLDGMEGMAGRVVGLIGASGLSRGAFAQRVGLDDSKLSKSLRGARRFSSLDLARIAELCRVTVDWLVTGEEPALAVAARATTGDARTAIEAARRYADLRADLAFLGYAQPWAPVTADPATGSPAEQGGRLAEQALARTAQAGRSVLEEDLPLLVEEVFGADVAVVGLADGLDGLAASSDDAKLIVLATSRVPARQRYTLAHELAHLLAGDDQGLHIDSDVYSRGDASEVRANGFAGAFLMPEEVLREVAGPFGVTEAAFATLACDLKVSPSALAIRLKRLGLIDAGTCDRIAAMTGTRAAAAAGRGEDFARRVTVASTPRLPGLLVQDAYAAYESGQATLRPYASLLGADVDDLRRALEWEGGSPDEP